MVKFAEEFSDLVFNYDSKNSDGLIFTVSFEASDERLNLGPMQRSQKEGLPEADMIDINYSAPELRHRFRGSAKERYDYVLSNTEKVIKAIGFSKFLGDPEVLNSEDTIVDPDGYGISHENEFAGSVRYRIKPAYQNIIPIGTEWKAEWRRKELVEKFNFKRGQDAKKTIGVGVIEAIADRIRQLQQDERVRHVRLKYPWKDQSNPRRWLEFSGRFGPHWFKSIFNEIFEGVDIFEEPTEGFQTLTYEVKPEYRDVFEGAYFKVFKSQAGDLWESMNFERGQNPKTALDIGSIRAIKNAGEKIIVLDKLERNIIDSSESDGDGILKIWAWDDTNDYGKRGHASYVLDLLDQSGMLKYIDPNSIAKDTASASEMEYTFKFLDGFDENEIVFNYQA